MNSTVKNKQQDDSCCGTDDVKKNKHSQNDGHDHDSHTNAAETQSWLIHWPLLTALLILVVMQTLYFGFGIEFDHIISIIIYGFALLLAGYNVFDLAWRKAKRFDFFNEFFLMSIATLGAFAIGSYSEGVAVMVFYSIGEWFQGTAVSNAKRSIKALLDVRPDSVDVIREGKIKTIAPADVNIGEYIQVKPGEKVALDGVLLSEKATFNTAALTGESRPDTKIKGEAVYAGMINLNTVSEIEVSSVFKDSKLSKILEMVQDATTRKSQTQLFISRFAKVYTPIVFGLALLLVFGPYLFVVDYDFQNWFYRGLVFLVISCPCALVVSIPLGYFGGIGLASKHGILFKGGNFLDVMTKITTVVMDKTGTLTKGVFKVQKVFTNHFDEKELVKLAAALESKSTHPIALAVKEYAGDVLSGISITEVEEIPGQGLKGNIDGKEVLAGNVKLLQKFYMPFDDAIQKVEDTIVVIAVDGKYAGYITIADEIKEDAKRSIKALLDVRPDSVDVIREGKIKTIAPADVNIGEYIQVKPGEKVALDGVLLSEKATFNTAALTGESRPDTKIKGEAVYAGMINLNTVSEIEVSSVFKDSKLSKILEMVQDATTRKSQTQLFISRFAKVYTPIVFGLALLLVFGPYLFVVDYDFQNWFYRGLVFLVISCPCALVVSIPLGYFGGIGLASKHGILFKGGNFLDVMTKITTVVMDKTGTLTKGVFKVQKVFTNHFDEKELVKLAAALESKSTHPLPMQYFAKRYFW